jgi:hypothetical protein
LRFERVDNLGAYRIPPETGLLIPADFAISTGVLQIELTVDELGDVNLIV